MSRSRKTNGFRQPTTTISGRARVCGLNTGREKTNRQSDGTAFDLRPNVRRIYISYGGVSVRAPPRLRRTPVPAFRAAATDRKRARPTVVRETAVGAERDDAFADIFRANVRTVSSAYDPLSSERRRRRTRMSAVAVADRLRTRFDWLDKTRCCRNPTNFYL